jgi:hypothetical protein
VELLPEASVHVTLTIYMRPFPVPARSARRFTVKFPVISQRRRLSQDYEVLPASSEAMIYLAMTRLMIRRLAAT